MQVISIGSNNASVNVSSTAGLAVGDSVLVIQMKGAKIYTINNTGYGDVTDYNGAGDFEYAIICEINNNTVSFNAEFSSIFDGFGSVQLVTIPKYENITVCDTLTGQPWDGTTGGVIILEATNTITLNAVISASGIGFRGGISDYSTYNCAWFDNFPSYAYDITTGYGAMKGEGVAYYGTETAGKGALADGGGGGNDHNSGGGGGGNLASGGDGGDNNDANPNNCTGSHPGIGGKALNNLGKAVFLGGGGGAGHANNNLITDGGIGGGIIILVANNIEGNGNSLLANGTNGGTSINDGAGGGGAGGSVLLFANSINSPLTIEAKGGNGGNAGGTSADRCYGPGGGGSGGTAWYKAGSTPPNISANLSPGTNGIVTSFSTACAGQSNGADNGQAGFENFRMTFNTNAFFEGPSTLDLGPDTAICAGISLNLFGPNDGRYVWSTGSTDQFIIVISPGEYYLTLFYGACTDYDTIFVDVQSNPETVLPADTILCSYLGVDLDAGNPNGYYTWSTGETSQSINVVAEGDYSVTITNTDDCTNVNDVTVRACSNSLEIPNLITPNGDGNNDTWIIETIYSYPGNSVEIYNRNGALLFQTENYNNDWMGANLPTATYFYVIDYNNGGNKQYGSISIVREK
ncbi:MAG: gliding motility-associated C-terminal domain-containing protein [Flavobacteriales bacterium]|nr:gliding motility-associated C-terminal domain-containing protein [Flavobacteriales bacterium]